MPNMHSGETCSYDLDGEQCLRWPGYVLVDTCHPGPSSDPPILMCWRHTDAIVLFNRGENPGHVFTANQGPERRADLR